MRKYINRLSGRPLADGGKEKPPVKWMAEVLYAFQKIARQHRIFIKIDQAGNIKPSKEKSTEKIDGAVALIMALDRALRHSSENTGSVYDERGLLFIQYCGTLA